VYYFLEKDLRWLGLEIEELQKQEKELRAGDAHVYAICNVLNNLRYLQAIFSQAAIALPAQDGTVGLGSVVKAQYFLGKGFGKLRVYEAHCVVTYEIGSYLVSPEQPNRISYDSMIGRELLGARVGQERRIDPGSVDAGGGKIPTDFNLKILEITNVPT
jgi:transcription elongation GreA/GreB family factor